MQQREKERFSGFVVVIAAVCCGSVTSSTSAGPSAAVELMRSAPGECRARRSLCLRACNSRLVCCLTCGRQRGQEGSEPHGAANKEGQTLREAKSWSGTADRAEQQSGL